EELKKNLKTIIPLVTISIAMMVWDILGENLKIIPSMTATVREFFHHLQPIMATYMLFSIGKPYLIGVWRFFKFRVANMDTLIGIGTFTAFIYSFIISAFEESLAPFIDVNILYYDVTIVVIGFITIGKFLEANAKAKTNQALQSLLSLQAKSAIVRINGSDQEVELEKLQIGDEVVIKPGTKIPVDGTVIEGESYIDESMITGESMPIHKTLNAKVTAGTINQDGFLLVKADAIGKDSLLAHIIDLVKSAQNSRAPIQKLADQLSAVFVPSVIIIALASLLGWLLIATYWISFDKALVMGITSFVGVLVIACPCALGLATPTAIIVGVGKGAKNGILIKNAEALEKLSKIKNIVFDKTGTLTNGKPEVVSFKNISNLSDDDIIAIASSLEKNSEHPLAHAINNFAASKKLASLPIKNFQSHRGKGLEAEINASKYYLGNENFIQEITKINLTEAISNQTNTPVILSNKTAVLAYFFIGDTIKDGSKQAIKQLKEMKIKTHLATGDHQQVAESVGKELHIDDIHSRLLPEDKQILIKALQNNKNMVAVAGDGVNDAPALALADVGIAMSTGTDTAIETADITLLHGDISKITQAIHLSRSTLKTIKENLFWAFFFNIIGIPLAAGVLYPYGISLNPAFAGAAMAFSSVLVVTNSLRLKFAKL
ncbi:cadmium-translocating P-type ATPase, partial [Candidatus Peregrinibacteria bacterium]|nr:cadmium-translocating P-type ATPase [Candidatus Peregrinibacteria bacterium]